VSKLSQAAAHPRRGTIITRNGFFPARNERHATQPEPKKQRRKACSYQRFTCKKLCNKKPQIDADERELICVHRRLSAAGNSALVRLLTNESRDVEIIDARSPHHRPWEVVGRSGYVTRWRRGNRRRRSDRRN